MSQAFNFAWLLASWSASEFTEVVTGTLAATEAVHGSPTCCPTTTSTAT